MKTKNLISLILAFCFVWLSASPAFAQSEDTVSFEGSRTTAFVADYSDVENFINGGRSAFDLALRKNKPEWLNVSTKTVGRDFQLSFTFSFSTLEDYKSKIAMLTTQNNALVFNLDNGFLLIESFSSLDFLNFVYFSLDETVLMKEYEINEIFKVKSNMLNINGENFEQGERVNIVPDSFDIIKFDSLEIATTAFDNGSYNRQFIVSINTEDYSEDKIDIVEKRFNSVGETTRESGYGAEILTVDFTAYSTSELSTQTITCLGVASAISENQMPLEGTTVSVTRSEFVDWESLKRNEDSDFSTTYYTAESQTNLSTTDETSEIFENGIHSTNSTFVCSYEQPFAFSEVFVITDFSSLTSKITKKIDFVAPTYMVSNIHEKIKKSLSKKLIRGCALNIYDEAGLRHYEVSFSTWFGKEADEFSKTFLGSSVGFNRSENLIVPFIKNNCEENGKVKSVFGSDIRVTNVTTVYIFSKIAKAYIQSKELSQSEGENIIVAANWGAKKISTQFEYQKLNLIKCGLIIVIIIIILVAIIIIKRYIRKAKEKSKERKELKKSAKLAKKSVASSKAANVHSQAAINEPPLISNVTSQAAPLKDAAVERNVQPAEPSEDNFKSNYSYQSSEEKICLACATFNNANSKFCQNCGAKLN